MNSILNETHDPTIKSWVVSANDSLGDFPIQNLPFGVCRRRGTDDPPRICVAIGDLALDVAACDQDGLFPDLPSDISRACKGSSLNALMALGHSPCSLLRRHLHNLLRANGPSSTDARKVAEKHLLPIAELELLLPVEVGDFTDFYASIHHATLVGSMFRPENPLLPNYKHLPVAYHGRASSVVVSGTPVRRPVGQTRPNPSGPAIFGPTRQLDYELEMGFFIGRGNHLGAPVGIADAETSIFGLCIVNDWSARDMQTWEGQPLGPFLSKNFATTISPWVVTLEALAPFRVPALPRSDSDPPLLPYLFNEQDRALGGFDIIVEAFIRTETMRQRGCDPLLLSRGNVREVYWTLAQMLAHHTSNGCNLRTGDLLATGTISGDAKNSRGSLLELTRRGEEPIRLPTGELRSFLEDGDEVTMRAGSVSSSGFHIGFGSCSGIVQPAVGSGD